MIDSRPSQDGRSVRRRRECLACGRRYTTYEYVEMIELQVVKRDGRVEPYHRNKLLSSIRTATTKRPVSMEDIDDLISRIETRLYSESSKEVQSKLIGDQVIKGLKKLDDVAYIRYASVYRRFKSAETFIREARKLL